MRAVYYKKSPSGPREGATNSYVAEAMAIKAARTPPKSPPKIMPVTPTLKKVVRGRKRRRTV